MTFMAARIKQQHQPKKNKYNNNQKLHETKVNIKTNKNNNKMLATKTTKYSKKEI